MPPRRAAAAATADPKGKGKATAGAAAAAVVVDPSPPSPAATAHTTTPASNATPRPPPVGQSLFLDTGDDDLSAVSSDNEPSFPTHPSNPNNENDNDSDNAELHSDSDDSDPVIKTYDIHLSTTLTPYLHLFQYPVRSTSSPYSRLAGACPSAARIKPTTGVLEVDIPINTDRHYDQEKGRRWGEALRKARIARDARISGGTSSANPSGTSSRGPGKRRRVEQFIDDDDDEDPNDETIFVSFDEAKARGRVLTQQTLGAKLQPDHTRYMIGVFRNIPSTSGGEAKQQLHLTPLKGTLQLRPQFGHIDTANQLDKELQRSLRIIDSSSTGNASSAAPPAARALQASVKNPNEDISGGGGTGGGEGGALRVLRREEGEDWAGMGWVDQDEEAAWEVFEGMFLPGTGADVDEGEREEEREKVDVDVDVNMTGIGEDGTHGDKQQEKEKEKLQEKTKKIPTKSNTGPVKLKTVITGEEYLQLLAAPRIDKDFS